VQALTLNQNVYNDSHKLWDTDFTADLSVISWLIKIAKVCSLCYVESEI